MWRWPHRSRRRGKLVLILNYRFLFKSAWASRELPYPRLLAPWSLSSLYNSRIIHADSVLSVMTEPIMVHFNHTAIRLATNAHLQALQPHQIPALARPATRIHSSTSVRSRRAVSTLRAEMTIVPVERDIGLMGWRRRIRSSSGWRFQDRSIGSLLRRE
jgi:hypothetical protein